MRDEVKITKIYAGEMHHNTELREGRSGHRSFRPIFANYGDESDRCILCYVEDTGDGNAHKDAQAIAEYLEIGMRFAHKGELI